MGVILGIFSQLRGGEGKPLGMRKEFSPSGKSVSQPDLPLRGDRRERGNLMIFNRDGLVKSPSAALRFNFVVAAHLVSALHSSVFARLASGAFYETIVLATFYEIINRGSCKTLESSRKSSFRASEARPGIQDFQAILDSGACPGPRSGVRPNDGGSNFCRRPHIL